MPQDRRESPPGPAVGRLRGLLRERGVYQRRFERAPGSFEDAKTGTRGVGAPEIHPSEAAVDGPSDCIPQECVIWSEPPIVGIRGAELVDHRAVPRQEDGSADRPFACRSDRYEAEAGLHDLTPEEAEESTRLDRHTQTSSCHQMEPVEDLDEVGLPIRSADIHAFALGPRYVTPQR